MCNERTVKENEEFFTINSELSRRQLGKAAAGAGLAMMLPPVANALSPSDPVEDIEFLDVFKSFCSDQLVPFHSSVTPVLGGIKPP